jgi:para-aminobenzoate N-oxygenase AurF
MTSLPFASLQVQLGRKSTPYRDPLQDVAWASLDQDGFWLPEQALSLYGLEAFDALSSSQRQALSRYEFIHLLQAGVWLETIFIERLSRSLQQAHEPLPHQIYHLHEIREEAGHCLMFLELMRRSGLPLPVSPFPRLRLTNLLARHAPFGSAVFWIAVLIGEQVPDRINRFIRQHRTGLCKAASDLANIHIVDEARHIAHAQDTLETRLRTLPHWQAPWIGKLIGTVLREFVGALFFPETELYRLAGLPSGVPWVRSARDNPQRRQFVEELVRPTLDTLERRGFSLDWR